MAHLFFNMLGLWMFGSELERLWGTAATLPSCWPACWRRRRCSWC
jgi:membrane associated rhomboid family serine protease